MEILEYLTVRRAYNLVRHDAEAERRLTFPEFAILCRLHDAGGSLNTSEIAEYQGSLRPTMTHRTKHLSTLNYISRSKGETDRRNVVCSLTDEGASFVEELCTACCSRIKAGQPLSRVDAERMCCYVDAMGSIGCKAGELVMLGILVLEDKNVTVSSLVDQLGMLQPTVSMSVAALEEDGYVGRRPVATSDRGTSIILTDAGKARANEMVQRINAIVVHRKPRSKK